MVPGVTETVTVFGFDEPQRLKFAWSDGVAWTLKFAEEPDGATWLSVEATGFSRRAATRSGSRRNRGLQHRSMRPEDIAGNGPVQAIWLETQRELMHRAQAKNMSAAS